MMQKILKRLRWEDDLPDEVLRRITELCFLPNDNLPLEIDNLFIFGTSISFNDVRDNVKKIIDITEVGNIIITGGLIWYPDAEPLIKPQSHLILENIKDIIPSKINIFIEDKSTNTLENIIFSLSYINTLGSNSLLYMTKSFHSRRAVLTLKKLLPNVNLMGYSYDAFFPKPNMQLTSNNWWTRDDFKQMVLGEVERIITYGSRGDIGYPQEIRELCKIISNLVAKIIDITPHTQ